MKSISAAIAIALFVSFAPLQAAPAPGQAPSAFAPTLVRVSSELQTDAGEPRSGDVLLEVALYNDDLDPTPLWLEQQLVTLDANGRYSVLAGATQEEGLPKDLLFSGAARYIGVAVQGEPEHVRIMLVTVPYAAKALDADTLGGKPLTDFVLSTKLDESVKSVMKDAGVRTNSDPGAIGNVITANFIPKYTDGAGTTANSAIFQSGNNVGIGTTTPTQSLHVLGNVGHQRLAIQATGASTVAGFQLTANANTWEFQNRGAFEVPANRFAFYNAGIERVVFTAAGNVGVGTGNPLDKLHIFGTSGHQRIRLETTAPGTVAGFTIVSNSATWEIQNRGGADTPSNRLAFFGQGVERMSVTTAGNVGIGITNPTVKLQVAGDVVVSGNIGAKYQDVAEWVETATPLEAGTVVVVDPAEPNHVMPSTKAYDTSVAGAVSAQPGLILGEKTDTNAMIAQSGRVRVKVDASYGAVKIGDLLVTSPTPGYAMVSKAKRVGRQRMHRPGTLLGKALEPLEDGQGEILVLLTLQ